MNLNVISFLPSMQYKEWELLSFVIYEFFSWSDILTSFRPMMTQNILQIGDEFRALQETRVKTYASLQEAHKIYLKSAPDYDFKTYQKEVAKATDTFNDISQQVIGLETELGDSELAQFVRKVSLILPRNSS